MAVPNSPLKHDRTPGDLAAAIARASASTGEPLSLSASGTTRLLPASANRNAKLIARDKQQGTPVADGGAEGTACNWLELLK